MENHPHCVYIWRYPDGKPFYVGIGSFGRAHSRGRNPLVDNIRKKIEDSGQSIIVEVHNYPDRDSCKKEEMRLIQEYGRRSDGSGLLGNMTNGGDGVFGLRFKMTEQSRQRISTSLTGRKLSEEHKVKLREAVIASIPSRPQTLSDDQKKKISASLKGRKLSEAHKEALRKAHRKLAAAKTPVD